MNSFDAICQKHATWIIKYTSPKFSSAVFLIWYTDIDEHQTDKFLTYKDGAIFSTDSLINLKNEILNERLNLVEFENLGGWLSELSNGEITETAHYNTVLLTDLIRQNNFSKLTLDLLTDFLNIFGDYVDQDEKNEALRIYTEGPISRTLWEYYYDFHFWPEYNPEKKTKIIERPALTVDVPGLLQEVTAMIEAFDQNISFTRASR